MAAAALGLTGDYLVAALFALVALMLVLTLVR